MNEQIRKIAAEAGLHYYKKSQRQEDLEKFAELIVRECMAQVKSIPIVAPGGTGCDAILREHFGIEE